MVPKSSIFRRFNRLSTRPAFPDSSCRRSSCRAQWCAGVWGPASARCVRPERHSTCSHGFFTSLRARLSLDPAVADGLAGGMDPQALSEMSHLSAAALLDRVRHAKTGVLTLVETVGVDEIAELWSDTRIIRPACCGDRICCVRGCDRIATQSRICGAWVSRWPLPPPPSPAWIRLPVKMTSCDWPLGAFVGDFGRGA